jgi:hypothetical protein
LLTTYLVSSAADSGSGSLRQAILDAVANPGSDEIHFNIGGGGAQTISPLSALPTVSDGTTVDATTQPGFSGTPLIQLSGVVVPSGVAGLRLDSGKRRARLRHQPLHPNRHHDQR